MRLSGAAKNIRTKLAPKLQRKLVVAWELVNVWIINLNSFILLYYREQRNSSMKYVICAGAAGYALILILQVFLHRRSPMIIQVLQKTKNVFRLIYTAIYLTVIMLDVLAVVDQDNKEYALVFYGWLFIWVTVWGTKCLWLEKAFCKLKRKIYKQP